MPLSLTVSRGRWQINTVQPCKQTTQSTAGMFTNLQHLIFSTVDD